MRRRGFTLIEILVVITIILVLVSLVAYAFKSNEGQKTRDAARTVQSAILGAKDRALHAKARRGFRVIRDAQDQNVGLGLVYLQPLDFLSYDVNSFALERLDVDSNNTPDPPGDVVILNGAASIDWFNNIDFLSSGSARVRIPSQLTGSPGQWYQLQVNQSGKYALTSTNKYLQITSPFIDPGPNPTQVVAWSAGPYTSCDIDIGNELLPMNAPTNLPSGVIIDLARSSANAKADLMFNPNGTISGVAAAQGPIRFLLRDIRDYTAKPNAAWVGADDISDINKQKPQFSAFIVAMNPQTGSVQVFETDPTDQDNDGMADDLFRYAKLGSIARGG